MVISLSSFLTKNKEITGDVLNKAHPNPMGRVLNTTCCRNIPIFVPRSTEIKNLFCCFLSMFFKKKLILNPFRIIKKIIAPNNLISVVRKGDKLLLRKTILEKRPPRTAHKTDKKGKAKILKLFFSEKEEFSSLKSLPFLRIMNSEIVTIIIQTHDLVVKFSLIKNSPDKAAINGERVSIDKVFLVPIVCSDFK